MRLYRNGATGEAVRDIQGRLARLGFDCSDDPEAEFRSATEVAVRAFQDRRGLPVDGIVGPETWRALVESGYQLGDRLLYRRQPMQRGDDVGQLQRFLNSLGFDAGNVDGIFGPDTLGSLLEFQRNRGLAEDGICGPVVCRELEFMKRATSKGGREEVRERQWLRGLSDSIAGHRILVDAACRNEPEANTTWTAASACALELRELGATPVLSRSIDARPPERIRAQRANHLGVDLVVSFMRESEQPAVYYFSSEFSSSEAGQQLATEVASRLGMAVAGKAMPILKETRPVSIAVAATELDEKLGRETAQGLQVLFAAETEP